MMPRLPRTGCGYLSVFVRAQHTLSICRPAGTTVVVAHLRRLSEPTAADGRRLSEKISAINNCPEALDGRRSAARRFFADDFHFSFLIARHLRGGEEDDDSYTPTSREVLLA
ncbi:unnamed protein product [Heligmosomoides polygyrus]|uniref:Secreted protein n=1 Tax=Heligmosomoides polygyrus TaxID=6339 RepID=A0A183F8Q4_HELPZ|nr:unnamed protein product [Heligmosomoides polygyrus]